jgi:hypothetical protein
MQMFLTFFDDGDYIDDVDEEADILNKPPPQIINIATNGEEVEVAAANHLELSTAASHERRTSGASSGHLSILASISVAQSKAKTRQNIICSTIETVTSSNNNFFAAFLQQQQMAEDYKVQQHQLDREKELDARRSSMR